MGIGRKETVVVVVGKGNKGGDGMCAARHLINNGWRVKLILLSKNLSSDSKHHFNLLRKMGVPHIYYVDDKETSLEWLKKADVVIDALIGYRLKGPPRGDYGRIIREINSLDNKVISFDIPTGVESTSGKCRNPCLKAEATLTLAIPKKALGTNEGKKCAGKIYLADIGIPKNIYNKIKEGIRPEFGGSESLLEEVK